MGAPREDARWFLVETQPIPGARDHLLRVLFASSPEFKEQIEGCQQEGLLPDSLFQPGSTHTFKFIPDRGAFPMGGRRIRLNIPPGDLGGLSGELAVKLVVDAQGVVQSKDLLFSTDERLGQLVLAGIERWLKVVSRGDTPGPYIDLAYLGFGPGGLEVMITNNFSLTKRDPKAAAPRT